MFVEKLPDRYSLEIVVNFEEYNVELNSSTCFLKFISFYSVCEQQPPTETQEQSCDQTGSDSVNIEGLILTQGDVTISLTYLYVKEQTKTIY